MRTMFSDAFLAQLAEFLSVKQTVSGSNPLEGDKLF